MGTGFWLTAIAGLIGAGFVYVAGRMDARAEVAQEPTTKTPWGLTTKGLVSFLAVLVAFCFAAAGNVVQKLEQDKKAAEQIETDKAQTEKKERQERIEEAFKERSTTTLAEIKVKNEALEDLLAKVEALGSVTKEKVDQSLRDLGSTSAKVDESSRQLKSVAVRQENSIKSLEGIAGGQVQALLDLWRINHPLGPLTVKVNISYPIRRGIGGLDDDWLRRVTRSRPEGWAVINDADDPLNPRPEAERREYSLLKQPELDVSFVSSPLTEVEDLVFRSTDPKTLVYVHNEDAELSRRIDIQVSAKCRRIIDSQKILSFIDLYGSDMIIALPETAPAGSTITSLSLEFGDVEFGHYVAVPVDQSNRRNAPRNEPFTFISYRVRLTDRTLGPKPHIAGLKE